MGSLDIIGVRKRSTVTNIKRHFCPRRNHKKCTQSAKSNYTVIKQPRNAGA